MKRLEPEKVAQWKDLGIYTLLEFSCHRQPYSYGMLLDPLHFWEGSTNTFHTRCGMITPTLFGVSAITGLKPTGRLFDYAEDEPLPLEFKFGDSGKPTYNNFIHHHARTSGPVTEEEHVAFLNLWLSCYVFCSRSMQVAKQFSYLATQLHQGTRIALAPLLLANLYECLTDISTHMSSFDPKNPKKKNVLAYGPLWLLQYWLNATFSKDIAPYKNNKISFPSTQKHVVWQNLLPLTPSDKTTPNMEVFTLLFTIMLTRVDFEPFMAPFHDQKHGPKWFIKVLPPTSTEGNNNAITFWRRFLTPQFLSTIIVGQTLGMTAYQPNLVARQFGLCQPIPKHLCPSYDVLVNITSDEEFSIIQEEVDQLWAKRPQLTPTFYQPAFYCIEEFTIWWQQYFTTFIGDPEVKLAELTSTFALL